MEQYKERPRSREGEQHLLKALEVNPGNKEALLALARAKSYPRPDMAGKLCYLKLIAMTIKDDLNQAAVIFAEYYRIYQTGIKPADQYLLAGALYRQGKFEVASRALEMVANNPDCGEILVKKSLGQLRCL